MMTCQKAYGAAHGLHAGECTSAALPAQSCGARKRMAAMRQAHCEVLRESATAARDVHLETAVCDNSLCW